MMKYLFRILISAIFVLTSIIPASAKFNGMIDAGELGKLISNSGSKVVVVNFWATWCGPCRLEMPHLKRLRSDFSAEDMELISVSGDSNDRAVQAFQDKMQLNFPIYRAGNDVNVTYSVIGVPKTMIFNKEGLVFEHMGYLSQKTLERIINAEIKKQN